MNNRLSLLIVFLAMQFLSAVPVVSAQSTGLDSRSLFFDKENKPYRVEKVTSADTIRFESGEKVRLIGLKAPLPPRAQKTEYDDRGAIIEKEENPSETLEERAFEFAKELLEGKEVRLEFDEQKKDKDFYLLAYIFLADDNSFANTEILRAGYANLSLTPPNLKHEDLLRAAYQEARKEQRGIHAEN